MHNDSTYVYSIVTELNDNHIEKAWLRNLYDKTKRNQIKARYSIALKNQSFLVVIIPNRNSASLTTLFFYHDITLKAGVNDHDLENYIDTYHMKPKVK